MSEVVWEDPPRAAGRGATVWTDRLQPLTEQPKRWAKFHFDELGAARTAAVNLRRGVYRIPSGTWEITSRKLADGGGDVYVRYMGDDNGTAE